MGSDKPIGPVARVFIYIGAILLVILLVVIICIAVMFLAPGTKVLGYQYVSCSGSTDYVFSNSTSLSVTDVYALEVTSDVASINVYPNDNPSEIKITHRKGISGITKSIDADLNVSSEIETRSFEYDTDSHKTLVFNVSEPKGAMLSNSSVIDVYISSDIVLKTISAKTGGGAIYYSSNGVKYNSTTKPDVEPINCDNLYLKTGGNGAVVVNNTEQIENYYVSTKSGSLIFRDVSTITADTLKFETEAGALSYINKEGNATFNLYKELFIKSNKKSGLGPQIRVNNLIGNLRVETFNGSYTFDKIGQEGNDKLVAITTTNSRIKLNEVHGQVSILSDGENVSNNINITNLSSGGSIVNNLDSGSGSIYINTLNGDAALNSSSGQIKIDNANANCNIWAHSVSGNIIIRYSESDTSFNTKKTTIITNSGNIDLGYISNAIDITILSQNKSTLNLTFSAIATKDNYINAENANINITLVGTEDALQHRIASTNKVTIPQDASGAAGSEIEKQDEDYFINKSGYDKYSYNYRIGYAKSGIGTRPYDSWGKLLIKTTGVTTVRAALKK